MRVRNPCVLERRRRLGWNVRFGMRNCAPHWENSHRDKPKVYRLAVVASKRNASMDSCTSKPGENLTAYGAALSVTSAETSLRASLHFSRYKKFFFASNIHEINHSQL